MAKRIAITQLDPLLEHRLRLGACVLLAETDRYSFSKLKELLGGTDGNLGAQLRKLEDNEYLSVEKTFQGRRPVSWYQLTPTGRKALKAHLKALQGLINYGH